MSIVYKTINRSSSKEVKNEAMKVCIASSKEGVFLDAEVAFAKIVKSSGGGLVKLKIIILDAMLNDIKYIYLC